MKTPVAPESVPQLRPIFEALARGTKRSKLRRLAVACPRDHILLEVYRGNDNTAWALYQPARHRSPDGMVKPAFMAQELSHDVEEGGTFSADGEPVVGCSCACTDWVDIRFDEMQDAIAQEKARLIVDGSIG